MGGSTGKSGSSDAGWLILAAAAGGAVIGGLLAYGARRERGRKETERNSVTGRDAESFAGAEFECGPCDPTQPLYRTISAGGDPAGKFWTPEDIWTMDDPVDELALPPDSDPEEIYEHVFDGCEICCAGIVAPQPEWGRTGGARQVVVIPRDC